MKHIVSNNNVTIQKNDIRLAKIPPGKHILADRGFSTCAPSYPNLNNQMCPYFLDGRNQFYISEISEDRVKCRLRYQSETHFSRLTNTSALKDRVPRGFFRHLHHINNWAHGCANLYEPFYLPAEDDFFSELEKKRQTKKQRKNKKKAKK